MRNEVKGHDTKYLKTFENTYLNGISTDHDFYSTLKLLFGGRDNPLGHENVYGKKYREEGLSGDALRDFGKILKNKIAYIDESNVEPFDDDDDKKEGYNIGDNDDALTNVERSDVCSKKDRYCDIRKLKTDGITDFKMIACINDTSHDDVVKFMGLKFKQFFKKEDDYNPFLETLTTFKRLNYTNYFENSTSYPSEDGRASSFVVYWVIRYDETSDRYSICFGITGMDIKFSDKIVGYKQHVEERVVGYEPCHCGFFYCQKCPIFGRSETSVPVFKKYVLSIDNQQLLKEYMMVQLYDALKNASYEKLLIN